MDISSRVNELFIGKTTAEVARDLGVSHNAAKSYLNGGSPDRDMCIKIACVCNTTLDWLMTGEGPMRRGGGEGQQVATQGEFRVIPRYEVEASAGSGLVVYDETAYGRLSVDQAWFRAHGLQDGKAAAVRASGKSMEPTIQDGDHLVLNLADQTVSRDGIYVLNVYGELKVKRLMRQLNGELIVQSDNPTYGKEVIKPEELDQIAVVGRVVWFGREL